MKFGIDLEIDCNGQTVRFARGLRLRMQGIEVVDNFEERGQQRIFHAPPPQIENGYGQWGVVASEEEITAAVRNSTSIGLELDTGGQGADITINAVEEALRVALSGADALLVSQILMQPKVGVYRGFEANIPSSRQDIFAFDLHVVSTQEVAIPDGWRSALWTVRVVYSSNWCVVHWHDPRSGSWDYGNGDEHLPVKHRRHSHHSVILPTNGPDRAARFIQDVLQHHDWIVNVSLPRFLSRWESGFLQAIASRKGGVFLTVDLPATSDGLRRVAGIVGMLSTAVNGMRGALILSRNYPQSVRAEATDRISKQQSRVMEFSSQIRDQFGLLADVSAGAQAASANRFQRGAGIIAAFVLAPSLIASLYGVPVQGLPGLQQAADGSQSAAWQAVVVVSLALSFITLVLLTLISGGTKKRWIYLAIFGLSVAAIVGVVLLI